MLGDCFKIKHEHTSHIEFYSIPIHAKFLLIINSINVVWNIVNKSLLSVSQSIEH